MPFTSISVQKYLDCPPPPTHIQSQKPKLCGRVLTSAENLKIFEEKARLKKQKEEAKKEREEARRKKAFLKSLGGVYNCVHIVINNNYIILTFEPLGPRMQICVITKLIRNLLALKRN